MNINKQYFLHQIDQYAIENGIEMGNAMTNNELAVKIYEKSGQYAIYDAVNKGILHADAWRDCIPCEDRTPHEDGCCLVCGTLASIKEEL